MVALSILLSSIAVSLFLTLGSQSSSPSRPFIQASASLDSTNPSFMFDAQSPQEPGVTTQIEKSEPSKNLTDNIITNYGHEIAKRNPSGPRVVNGEQKIALPPQRTLEELLATELNQNLKIDLYDLKDIRISRDASDNYIRTYLKSISTATENIFGKFTKTPFALLDELLRKKNPEPLYQYVTLLSRYSGDLLTLDAPPSWKTFHLEFINLQQEKIAVYQSLLEVDQDPVKAMVAINQIEKLDEKDQNLATVLNEQLKSLSI